MAAGTTGVEKSCPASKLTQGWIYPSKKMELFREFFAVDESKVLGNRLGRDLNECAILAVSGIESGFGCSLKSCSAVPDQ